MHYLCGVEWGQLCWASFLLPLFSLKIDTIFYYELLKDIASQPSFVLHICDLSIL